MEHSSASNRHHEPWNKGKLVGQKSPLRNRVTGHSEAGAKEPEEKPEVHRITIVDEDGNPH
jgi:hypothetical protein